MGEHLQSDMTLHDIIRNHDPAALLIKRDERCEWVRSTLGIIGLIRISEPLLPPALQTRLSDDIAHAYAVLDEFPDSTISFDDLWNLLLLIWIPWTRDELEQLEDIANILLSVSRDTAGSRKVILWRDRSPAEYVGPLGRGAAPWLPSSGDPLRAAVTSIARDDEEQNALDLLFKRRITEEDVDQLLRTLGRPSEPQ